jgi:serine/threonine protein phosphatase PrpC
MMRILVQTGLVVTALLLLLSAVVNDHPSVKKVGVTMKMKTDTVVPERSGLPIFLYESRQKKQRFVDAAEASYSEMSHPPIVEGMMRNMNLVQQWNKWASQPVVGSYQFGGQDDHHNALRSGSSSITATILHFPLVDMETILSKNGNAKSIVSNDPDTVVLTRRGNKFSQGEMPLEDEPGGGIYRQPNQDRVSVMRSGSSSNHRNDFWIGLFDGHGSYGHTISQYCSLEFAKNINERIQSTKESGPEEIKATLRSIFLSINDAMPRLFGSGTTGIGIWKRSDRLYVSNVGDSVVFVAGYDKTDADKVEITYQNKPHKPDDPDERRRIEAAGGHVEEAPVEGASARLLIPMPDGMNIFGLAMSRSLGDHDGLPVGLSAEPTTDLLDLAGDTFDFDRKEYFVVAATDGMIDHGRLSAMDVAQAMARAFASGKANAPTEAAWELIERASKLWADEIMMRGYRDDISIAACKLQR